MENHNITPSSLSKHSFFNHPSSAQHGTHFQTALQDFSRAAPIVFNGNPVDRGFQNVLQKSLNNALVEHYPVYFS